MAFKVILPVFLAVLFVSSYAHATGNPPVTVPTGTTTTTGSTASTGAIRDTVCDPDVFERMRQKGWMEAQRENIINQTMILKPDNIFAYTCYDKQLAQALKYLSVEELDPATNSPTTKFWTNTVTNTASSIMNGQIGAVGTDSSPLLTPTGVGATQSTYNSTGGTAYQATPTASTGDSSFSCNVSAKVWQASQCANVSGGQIPSLNEILKQGDSRAYPGSCPSSSAPSKDVSGATDAGKYEYDAALKQIYETAGAGVKFTAVDLHLCQTRPYSELSGLKCPNDPVSGTLCHGVYSGILKDGYLEVSCTNPGCHAVKDPGGTKIMTCKPN